MDSYYSASLFIHSHRSEDGFSDVDLGNREEEPQDQVVIEVKATETTTKQVPPDGGFGWWVAAGTFAITFLMTGFFKCGAKFGPHVASEFPGTSSEESGWVFGLITGLSLLLSPAASMVVGEFGHRVAIITGGLVCSSGLFLSYFATSAGFLIASLGGFLGVGSALVVTTASGCVAKYFKDKKHLAMTFALSGGCLGAFAVPEVVHIILGAVGLRYTFLIVGAVFLAVPLLGLLYGPPEAHFISVTEEVEAEAPTPEPVDEKSESSGSSAYKFTAAVCNKLGFSYLKEWEFLLLAVSMFLFQLGNPTYRGYVADQGKNFGATASQVALYGTLFAVGDLLARVTYGLFSSWSPLVREMELWCPKFLAGVLICLLPGCSNHWILALFSTLASYATAVVVICTPLVLIQNHGAENLTKTFGLLRMLQAIANFLIRPMSSLLVAHHGSAVGLYFSGTSLLLSSLVALAVLGVRTKSLNAFK